MPLQTTDWVEWHPDTVYAVQGANEDTNIPSDNAPDSSFDGLLVQASQNRAAFIYSRAFGGDYPSDDPTCAFGTQIVKGLTGGADWPGFCPTSPIGTFTDAQLNLNPQGSGWAINNGSRGGIGGGVQLVNSVGDLSGWKLRPWRLFADYSVIMNDDDLYAELLAAIAAATPPGDGWTVEYEASHPFLESLEFAPNELATNSNTGAVSWIQDPTGWAYYNTAGVFEWFGNAVTGGDQVAVYDGGVADWVPVPDAWMPTQIDDPTVSGFVTPDDEDVATIALTLLADFNAVTAGGEGTDTGGGRFNQSLAFRGGWRLPKFRLVREVAPGATGAMPPRRFVARSDELAGGAGRFAPQPKSVQRGRRNFGAVI